MSVNIKKQTVARMERSVIRGIAPGITHTFPGVRPSGLPSAVQNRSRRFCHFVSSGLPKEQPRSPDGTKCNPGKLDYLDQSRALRWAPSGLPKKQRGISLIIVIFLLAVVSVMTLSMMNLTSTQHVSSLYTARGAQAYFAARSGIEYAITQVIAAGCAGITSPVTVPGATVPTTFTVTTACAPVGTYNEGNAAAPYTIYRLTTTASDGNFQVPDVANRQITVTVRVP